MEERNFQQKVDLRVDFIDGKKMAAENILINFKILVNP